MKDICHTHGTEKVKGICPDCYPKRGRNIAPHKDYLEENDYIQFGKERLAELKAEYPNGEWRRKLFDGAVKATTKPAQASERNEKYLKWKDDIHKECPVTVDVNDVCLTIPAPHDKEGIKIFEQKLRETQPYLGFSNQTYRRV